MLEDVSSTPASRNNKWREISLALLVGIIVLGSSVFLVTVLQAPIGPPIEAAPLFAWNTTAASVAIILLWQDNKYGYPASVLTGMLIIVSLGLLAMGVFGGIDPESSPIGPLSYAVLAIALIGTTVAAWQDQSVSQPSPESEEPTP